MIKEMLWNTTAWPAWLYVSMTGEYLSMLWKFGDLLVKWKMNDRSLEICNRCKGVEEKEASSE